MRQVISRGEEGVTDAVRITMLEVGMVEGAAGVIHAAGEAE